MTKLNRLSLEEVEKYLVYITPEHSDMLPVRVARQLADTMRENERMKNAIEYAVSELRPGNGGYACGPLTYGKLVDSCDAGKIAHRKRMDRHSYKHPNTGKGEQE